MDPCFLDSVLVGGEWPAYWILGWVGSRTTLDYVKKILDPIGTQNSEPSVVQPVASCYYTDRGIRATSPVQVGS
jgi:hypothetical protein